MRIYAQAVTLSLGTSDAGVSVTGGAGYVLVTTAGIAGEFTASVGIHVPGLPNDAFHGTFTITFNSTATAVNSSLTVGSDILTLNLPAGPYLRVQGTGIQLSLLGQHVTGDFAFERRRASGRARSCASWSPTSTPASATGLPRS